MATVFKMDHKFDPETKRHYLNDNLTVLHCHHYASLYSQLAIDAKETDLLTAVAEESFYEVLVDYYRKNSIDSVDERMDIAAEYFSHCGLGKLDVVYAGEDAGEVHLPHSHVDDGWIKKWGKYDKPVNYIGSGFIRAMFCAVFNMPLRSYNTYEYESIVMGADVSKLKIVKQ